MAPVFEMFNHAEDNNAFFDFDKINKKLYVAAIKERVCRTVLLGRRIYCKFSAKRLEISVRGFVQMSDCANRESVEPC